MLRFDYQARDLTTLPPRKQTEDGPMTDVSHAETRSQSGFDLTPPSDTERTIPWLVSVWLSTAPSTGAMKLGQPVPLSNFFSALKSSRPHPAQA